MTGRDPRPGREDPSRRRYLGELVPSRRAVDPYGVFGVLWMLVVLAALCVAWCAMALWRLAAKAWED